VCKNLKPVYYPQECSQISLPISSIRNNFENAAGAGEEKSRSPTRADSYPHIGPAVVLVGKTERSTPPLFRFARRTVRRSQAGPRWCGRVPARPQFVFFPGQEEGSRSALPAPILSPCPPFVHGVEGAFLEKKKKSPRSGTPLDAQSKSGFLPGPESGSSPWLHFSPPFPRHPSTYCGEGLPGSGRIPPLHRARRGPGPGSLRLGPNVCPSRRLSQTGEAWSSWRSLPRGIRSTTPAICGGGPQRKILYQRGGRGLRLQTQAFRPDKRPRRLSQPFWALVSRACRFTRSRPLQPVAAT